MFNKVGGWVDHTRNENLIQESTMFFWTIIYVQIGKMPSIDALIDGQVAGLEWLDSVDHLLEKYEGDSRTEAFSGIALPMNEE